MPNVVPQPESAGERSLAITCVRRSYLNQRDSSVLAPSKMERQQINALIREDLTASGRLPDGAVSVECLAPKDVTEHQVRHLAENYSPGDVAMFWNDVEHPLITDSLQRVRGRASGQSMGSRREGTQRGTQSVGSLRTPAHDSALYEEQQENGLDGSGKGSTTVSRTNMLSEELVFLDFDWSGRGGEDTDNQKSLRILVARNALESIVWIIFHITVSTNPYDAALGKVTLALQGHGILGDIL